MTNTHDHFQGKDPLTHLVEARKKGIAATAENHGMEIPGHLAALSDSAKEAALLLSALSILLYPFALGTHTPFFLLLIFSIGWLLWKMGRSALLGWNRLERLHRLIEEERWEIEHHRQQEKEELRAMYGAKGFSGKLLDQVVDVLMADENRLLQVMLEEELGLTLEVLEHPLKQAIGAGLGVFMVAFLSLLTFLLFSFTGLYLITGILFLLATVIPAKIEGNNILKTLVWNGATALFTLFALYFLTRFLL